MDAAWTLLVSGLGNLASYLAAHVLLCLLPAFFIAGAMTALIPKPSITRWLGRNAKPYVSYPAAAAAGSLLAVCSCTIVPLFAGIFRKGAGLGPAMTFLFFAPAGNIMALAYTGSMLGVELAVARIVLALIFGVGIGILMAVSFSRDDAQHDTRTSAMFTDQARISATNLGLLLALIAALLAGTAKVWPLTSVLAATHVHASWADSWQTTLFHWIPFDAAKGEEGVSVHGSFLIVMLLAIAAVAYRGMESIAEGFNRWTSLTIGLVAATLLLATMQLSPDNDGLWIGVTGRTGALALTFAAIAHFARAIDPSQLRGWLWESWRFVKQIFPLLVVGVFLVGVVRPLVRPEWIESLAGRNDVLGNFVAVAFGIFMYFPTLVEVPVAHMFLDLGMHRGPLLAYLMADPELSLQSILMTASVIGRRKTAAYVGWVAVFSATSGLLYGAWVDGKSPWLLVVALSLLIATLATALLTLHRQQRLKPRVP